MTKPFNKEQILEWQNHPVTLALKEAVVQRINDCKDELSDPSSDNDRDRFLKGMIWAFQETLEAKPDLEEETIDEIFSGESGE
mgnify:FL=1